MKHRLASLFLCMEAILHVSKTAIQEIVEELVSIGTVEQYLTVLWKSLLQYHLNRS